MRTARLAVLAAALALGATAAQAGEELKTVPATLDPAKAYLLVTLNDFHVF